MSSLFWIFYNQGYTQDSLSAEIHMKGSAVLKRIQKIMIAVLFLIIVAALPASAETRSRQTIKGPSSITLTAKEKVYPSFTSRTKRVYTIQNPDVAKVGEDGSILGLKAGKTYLVVKARATSRYLSAFKKIPVTVKYAPQVVQAENVSTKEGKTVQINAVSKTTKTYSSSDTSICVVDEKGLVTGISPGTAYVTVTARSTSVYVAAHRKVKVTVASNEGIPVVLRDWTGKVLSVSYVEKGESFALPGMKNESRYTFLGWSYKRNQVASEMTPRSVQMIAGSVIKGITAKQNLYMVVSDRSAEVVDYIESPDDSRYSTAIFVGDSRTGELFKTLRQDPGYDPDKVQFVYRYGQGLSWYKTEGYKQAKAKVVNANIRSDLPAAVIICLGINNLDTPDAYIQYLNKTAQTFNKLNCKLFFVSVNPVNSKQILYIHSLGKEIKGRTEYQVKSFNQKVRLGVAQNYQYIDSWSYLMKTGYSSQSLDSDGMDDGLHYTDKTTLRIYNYIISKI